MLNTSPEVLGAGFTGGHVVTITLQTGRPTLSTRAQTEAVINQLFEALNSDDVSALPLAQNAEYSGGMTPEPVIGEKGVRQRLQEFAPFMLRLHAQRLIIENEAAAALIEFTGVNGVRIEGTMFIDVEQEKISRIRSVFDSRPFFAGKN